MKKGSDKELLHQENKCKEYDLKQKRINWNNQSPLHGTNQPDKGFINKFTLILNVHVHVYMHEHWLGTFSYKGVWTETERPMGFISSAQCLEKKHHYTNV